MLRRLRCHLLLLRPADPPLNLIPTVLSRLSQGLLARHRRLPRARPALCPRAPLHRHPRLPSPPMRPTLVEPLLADLDAFVAAMDEIFGGAFLRAVPSGAGACPTCGGPAGRERARRRGGPVGRERARGWRRHRAARGRVRRRGAAREERFALGDGVGECEDAVVGSHEYEEGGGGANEGSVFLFVARWD
ncbi:hypothetical protein ZWY2020_013610 [Hordeum vulgare]|nr:hypothetical protein ZWY2020_013610 [Hordeum vulgare]